jgi:hypothetical protein
VQPTGWAGEGPLWVVLAAEVNDGEVRGRGELRRGWEDCGATRRRGHRRPQAAVGLCGREKNEWKKKKEEGKGIDKMGDRPHLFAARRPRAR